METKQLLRLCHSCGKVNEADSEILRCEKCGKGFLPLNYFEKLKAALQKAGRSPEELPNIGLSPINGLIVFW